MANVLTLLRKKRAAGSNIITYVFQCVLSGSYVNGGAIGVAGEILNFNAAANPKFISRPKLPTAPSGKSPDATDIRITRLPGGFDGQVEKNAVAPTPSNYIMRLYGAGSGAALPAELASNTYANVGPALVEAAGIVIEVDVPSKFA
jgi:hypothetical protein